MIGARDQQDDAGDAMAPTAEHLIGPHELADPGIGELQGEAGDGQHDEADRQHHVLHPLGEIHAQDGQIGGAVAGGDLLAEQQQVVGEHDADGAKDEHQIDAGAPTS